jgi:hypothetical protein
MGSGSSRFSLAKPLPVTTYWPSALLARRGSADGQSNADDQPSASNAADWLALSLSRYRWVDAGVVMLIPVLHGRATVTLGHDTSSRSVVADSQVRRFFPGPQSVGPCSAPTRRQWARKPVSHHERRIMATPPPEPPGHWEPRLS